MTKLKYVVVALANKIFWARRGFGASFPSARQGGGGQIPAVLHCPSGSLATRFDPP